MYAVVIFTNFLSVLFVRFHIKYIRSINYLWTTHERATTRVCSRALHVQNSAPAHVVYGSIRYIVVGRLQYKVPTSLTAWLNSKRQAFHNQSPQQEFKLSSLR